MTADHCEAPSDRLRSVRDHTFPPFVWLELWVETWHPLGVAQELKLASYLSSATLLETDGRLA